MMERMLLMRLDAGRLEGLGHLMRCLLLSRELTSRGVQALMLMRERCELRALLKEQDCAPVALPPDADEEECARLAGEVVDTLGGDALLVDLPRDLSSEEYEAYGNVGLSVILLDDHGPAAEKAELVINSIAHPDNATREPAGKGLYIGPEYMILDGGYARIGPPPFREQVKRLLVAMGGSDPHDITSKAARALSPLAGRCEVHALLGPAYPHEERLVESLAESGGKVVVDKGKPSDGLPRYLAGFDLAVLSFGTTAYGAACLGLPALHIAHDNFNALHAVAFEKQVGGSRCLGVHNDLTEPRILEAVSELLEDAAARRRLAERGKGAVDGYGTARVSQIVTEAMKRGRGRRAG